jgi:hypothetical protein
MSEDGTKKPEAAKTMMVCYAGVRWNRTEKVLKVYLYRVNDETGEMAVEPMVFDESKAMRASFTGSPGGMYSVEYVEEEGKGLSIYATTARFQRPHADIKTRMNMGAADDEARETKRALRDSKEDPLLEALAPIRRAYLGMNAPQKALFLSRVIYFISKYND